MALEERMDELRHEFGLDPEDLNLNLGAARESALRPA